MTNNSKELSIQITLGGFSFKIESATVQSSGELSSYDLDQVLSGYYGLNSEVEWSVPSVLIIPFEIFDHRYTENYLKDAALLNPATQSAIFAVRGEYVALWAVDKELYNYIQLRMPICEHTHSLIELINKSGESQNSIIIDRDNVSTLHIVIWGDYGLELAYSIECLTAEDTLFYIRRFSNSDSLMKRTIYLGNGIDSHTRMLLNRYYKNIISIQE